MARKILLADDSVTAQNMGRKILTDAGYDVITVNNGSAALKRVNEQKPDLIVLDVYMPGYSGLEVCARLKDSPETARIPILLTVGKLEPFKPEEANRVRADGFIVKPFEASELLSALTRLEDRMVPQAEGARFSTSVSGIERFSGDPAVKKSGGGDESDTGWKNRLRFPSKKKKEEAEPEPEPDFVTPSSFRDYRRGAGKTPASGAFPVSAPAATGQEPGLVPDIPRDITPDELDALSALVAKLDGPIPESENIGPLSEKIGPVEAAPAETVKEAEVVPAAAETKAEAEPAKPAVVEAAPVTSAAESVSPVVESAPVEAASPVVVPAEMAVVPEPAPVDRHDEPIFASAAAPEVTLEERPKVQEAQAAASEPAAEVAMTETAPEAEPATVQAETKAQEIPAAATSAPQAAEAEVPGPSAEELAEALRLLTPSTPTLAEAGAALAEELSRGGAAGSRWVAEAVALSPEEASVSLEAEMFRTFATSSAGESATNGDAAPAASGAAEVASAETGTPIEERPSAIASGAATNQAGRELKDSHSKPAEEAPREVAAVTFADAVRSEVAESVSATAETVSAASAQEAVSSSGDGSGGRQAMGKEAKGKGGKSVGHRSGAPAAASDAVEAAKQAEEAPKAMAAAASADNASDASSIASIVDSVLADLRPKIVEEIAKKLAKK